jgi:hypothetical protein
LDLNAFQRFRILEVFFQQSILFIGDMSLTTTTALTLAPGAYIINNLAIKYFTGIYAEPPLKYLTPTSNEGLQNSDGKRGNLRNSWKGGCDWRRRRRQVAAQEAIFFGTRS